jgi:hypothetical protein
MVIRGFAYALACAALVATPSVAQTTIDLTIQGTVPPACRITVPGGTVQLNDPGANGFGGSMAGAYSASLPMSFSCNAPFGVTLQSTRGGLRRDIAVPTTVGDFVSSLDYSLAYSIPLDNGGLASIADCSSTSIQAAPGCAVNTTYSAINQTMTAKISWPRPNAPILPGNYTDTVTIRVLAASW